MCKKVSVLMSTFNGEKYVSEQIDSILAQCNVTVSIFVRDDGSTDSTARIIENYAEKDKRVKIILDDTPQSEGGNERLGVGASFMELVYAAPKDCEYYAFSDQDDIWLTDKLSVAVSMLDNIDRPTLYTSNRIISDEKANPIGKMFDEPIDVSAMQILSKNSAAGCTMVWNKALHEQLCKESHRPSRDLLKIRIHDVWVAYTAANIGEIVYDHVGRIIYRQHGTNYIGAYPRKKAAQWKLRFKKLANPKLRCRRTKLYREFAACYPECINIDSLSSALMEPSILKNKTTLISHNKELRCFTGESLVGFCLRVLLEYF